MNERAGITERLHNTGAGNRAVNGVSVCDWP